MTSIEHQVLAPIDRSAASIEAAFLQAAISLNSGLESFEQLGRTLAAFLEDLNTGGMTSVSSTLASLSRRLMLISEALPQDAVVLHSLVEGNDGIAKGFDKLLENIRMMTIVARSARIESVVFDRASGLDSFTEEMGHLTRMVRDEVSGRAAQHGRLTDNIRQIARAQVDLDREFREKLVALAQELSDMFSLIEARQQEGVALINQIAERSGHISQAAGLAMMSLQSGDATRQRLEHVSAAVQLALDLHAGHPSGDIDLPEGSRAATVAALYRLQGAQLEDSVSEFTNEAGHIDHTLAQLIEDAHELVRSGQATYGAGDKDAESFLAELRSRLSAAYRVLHTCEQSRRSVEKAITELRVSLVDLSERMSILTGHAQTLVIIGLNAGLKATRLGAEGRSLVVIADELKQLAQTISQDSTTLVQAFAEIQQNSRRLDRDPDSEAAAGQTDQVIAAIVASLQADEQKIMAFLSGLDARGRTFDAELDRARGKFRSAAAMNADLLDVAETLAALGEDVSLVGDPGEDAMWVSALMEPRYTMAREREVHQQVVGRLAPAPDDTAMAGEDAADLLFAEAS